MRDLSDCIDESKNLRTFCCTVNMMPPLLYSLHDKSELRSLRIHGGLTVEQADIAVDIANLSSLAIERGSWGMMDSLPRWTEQLSETLSTLTLYVSLL